MIDTLVQPVRMVQEGNPYYPLPPDYPGMGPDAQRLARVNAVCLQETPTDLVHAWAFFRTYYLRPARVHWYKRYLESPPLHYRMVWDVGEYSKSAWAAPRSFAKSTVVKEIAMLLQLTRINFAVFLIQSTVKKYRKAIDSIKRQFEENPFLNDDFNPFLGAKLKATRGQRMWSTEGLTLPHGSGTEGGSVEGRVRGERPDLLLPDDIEYDEEGEVETQDLLEKAEVLFFRKLRPMMEEGTAMFMIGTRITRRSLLYTITEEGTDPRYRHWNRRVLPIENPSGTGCVWEAKWPKQKRLDLRAEMGESSYQSEYMNNPGAGSERILQLHPDYGTYRVEGDPPHLSRDPFGVDSRLIYRVPGPHGTPVEHIQPFGDWAGHLYRIMLIDFIRKPSKTSDYACIAVLGFDQWDNLWVLDVALEKLLPDPLIGRAFNMAIQWKTRVIGAEAVAVQTYMADRAASFIAQLSEGTGFTPRVFKIRYAPRNVADTAAPTKTSKAERIAAMEWRYNQHRIRYPADRRGEDGIGQLFYQTEYFTMNLDLLRHDDAIDTVAMHQYIKRSRGRVRQKSFAPRSAPERIAAGQLYDEDTGIPLALGLRQEELTSDLVVQARRHCIPGNGEDRAGKELVPCLGLILPNNLN